MYSSSGDIEIGATLRKARQDIGVTLDDVEYETKIRKRYLEALEREDYGDLPSAVYARGFLKTYANYLGLDGEELSQELKSRWETVQERQRREAAPKESYPGRRWSRDTSGGLSVRHARPRRISPLAILGLVLVLVLIAAAFSGLYWVGQNSRAPLETPGGQANQPEQSPDGGRPSESGGASEGGQSISPTTDTPTNGEAAGGSETERTATAEAAPSLPEVVRVTVTVEQVPAWLNVQTDGNIVFEQVAQPGFSQTYEAGRQVAVWTGNAGAVRLEINGQDYGALGAPGEVKRQVFTLKPAQED